MKRPLHAPRPHRPETQTVKRRLTSKKFLLVVAFAYLWVSAEVRAENPPLPIPFIGQVMQMVEQCVEQSGGNIYPCAALLVTIGADLHYALLFVENYWAAWQAGLALQAQQAAAAAAQAAAQAAQVAAGTAIMTALAYAIIVAEAAYALYLVAQLAQASHDWYQAYQVQQQLNQQTATTYNTAVVYANHPSVAPPPPSPATYNCSGTPPSAPPGYCVECTESGWHVYSWYLCSGS